MPGPDTVRLVASATDDVIVAVTPEARLTVGLPPPRVRVLPVIV
jgi:hypothetical protein